VLPKIAEGSGSQVWMIPSELSKALEGLRRRKVLKEHCRLRSVGCALEEPPVRASEEGGALIWSLVDENRRRTSSV